MERIQVAMPGWADVRILVTRGDVLVIVNGRFECLHVYSMVDCLSLQFDEFHVYLLIACEMSITTFTWCFPWSSFDILLQQLLMLYFAQTW